MTHRWPEGNTSSEGLVLLGGETLPLALLGTDSVADLRGRVAGMLGVMMGDVAFVDTIGGGANIDDTDCICSQNIQFVFKAREVDNGVLPIPFEP